ncbi:MAG: hypothetical protein GAK35_02286 [Herbaspirillum frisingense]|uniref:Uncharacterized protein n=1 Tax=Herbaspirillum frisingense TaxID=92645 RepID=A0A7V8FWC3_9BURK|nr:MAG: hypothetical protein GAK35_02286 [Herbaspirillum frisingense]
MLNTLINNMLSTLAHPVIHLAGTAHGAVEYIGRYVGML